MPTADVRWFTTPDGTRLKHPRRADVELAATCVAQCRPANLVDFRAVEASRRSPAE